jgi:hypothetical protein
MTRSVSHVLLRTAIVAGALACAACSSLPDQYCQKAADCDELLDPVGNSDDSVGVCAIMQQTELDAYRANSEDECFDLATAKEEYMACVVEEGCDGFNIFFEDECRSEWNGYAEAADDARGRCDE